MTDAPLPLDQGLFGRLRRDAGAVWEGYVAHDFVRALGRGTLPQAAFRHFLVQDYLFLIHFARAHALAGFKATQLADIRAAAAAVSAIVDVEMPLHVSYCAGWGLSEAQMAGAPEAMAYTRFVLERGLAGDLLDLQVALAPALSATARAASGCWPTRRRGATATHTASGSPPTRARAIVAWCALQSRRWTGWVRRTARLRAIRNSS